MQRETLLIPGTSGEIRAERGSRAWAWWAGASVLSFKPADAIAQASLPILAWSGSLAELDGGSPFDDDPRTWGPKGWSALELACTGVAALGIDVILRPHHRHVISDIPSCKRLVECDWALGARLRLALDPVCMCTDPMLASPKLADHLGRIFESTHTLPPNSLAAIVLPSTHTEDLALHPLLTHLLATHIPSDIPLLLGPAL